MKTGQLYIALSDQLLSWAQDAGQLFLFKIGTTSDPERRLRALNEGWPDEPGSGPCLNCTDWRWAERWHYRARAAANADEDQLKDFLKTRWRIFDRDAHPRFASARSNGATEVYQVREAELPELDELKALSGGGRNDVLKAGVVAAIAHHLRVELEALFPAVRAPDDFEEDEPFEDSWEPDEPEDDSAEEDRRREFSEQVGDLLSDQDDHGRSSEDGWLYGDD